MRHKKYCIVHILSGSHLRFFVSKKSRQWTYGILNKFPENLRKDSLAGSEFDYLLDTVVSGYSDDDSYWDNYKEFNLFATKQAAEKTLDFFFNFLSRTTWIDPIILRKDITLAEFEIVEV